MRVLILLLCAVACVWSQSAVKSPDGSIEMTISADNGQLAYTVTFKGKPVIDRSSLGLDIQDQPFLGSNLRIVRSTPGEVNETYNMLHGKANPVRNNCRTLAVELEETRGPNRKMTLEARAYNDGVAFRYLVPDQPILKQLRLAGEKTEFQLAKDGTTYPLLLAGFQTSYEDDYHVLPLSGLHPDSLAALPFLAELPGTAWVAITEAYIENYAGMYLTHSALRSRTLVSTLAPSMNEPGLAVATATPARSPWRVIMIGAEPGRLVESNIVINLNPPSAIADTSWIKPGKTAWDWWSGSNAEGVSFKPGMNTATMEHYIDFAAEAGLEYMLVDAGWALKGNGPNDSGSDLTRTNPEIDMPHILAHAREKKVGVWLWAHWTDIARQMDEVFPLFQKWGVVGVKIDFMNRDDQWMVDYYRRVVKKAAEHHLMIDFHGAFKPDGLRREYPNLLTREGVMGLEYSKWSARITPEHNLMLAFTRMLAGPMDYTPGGFDNVTREEFAQRNLKPDIMGTRAHQLALYPIFESALQMLSDYPGAYRGQKELEFLRQVPAVWDETHVVGGRPERYISIARRHGRDWFVGSITGWEPREIDLPLEFLGRGEFVAEIWSDAPDAATSPKHTTREEKRVNSGTVLRVKMAPGGGQAIHIRPAQ
jgi:alpha-glucosidase